MPTRMLLSQISLLLCIVQTCASGWTADTTSPLATDGGAIPTVPIRKINSDFSLLPDIEEIDFLKDFNFDTRILWMMRRYRNNPTFGLLENKLLSHSLLKELGIPQARVFYGAFATKPLGDWPMFDRQDFLRTMNQTKEVVEDHSFVLKPVSNCYMTHVLVMTHEKWEQEGWTLDGLAYFAGQFLDRSEAWYSDFGQKYEHRGVIVQENVLALQKDHQIHEVKIHVALGRVGGTRVQSVPLNFDPAVDLTFCDNEKEGEGPHCRGSQAETKDEQLQLCNKFVPMIAAHSGNITTAAAKIANAYGADFFRLDLFLSSDGICLVNEVTYPSFHSMGEADFEGDDCSSGRLVSAYKRNAIEIVNATSILHPLLQQIRVEPEEFMRSDFEDMEHADEAVYEAVNWTAWRPWLNQKMVLFTRVSVAIVLVAFAAFFVLSGVAVSRSAGQQNGHANNGYLNGHQNGTAPKTSRIPVLDNAKFYCACFLLFINFCYHNAPFPNDLLLADRDSWLSGSQEILWTMMDMIHLRTSVVCIVSGYLSRQAITSQRVRGLVLNLIAPTALWVFLLKPCLLPVLMSPSTETIQASWEKLASGKAYQDEWYLQALILWRLFSFVVHDMRPGVVFFASCVISGLGGYLDFKAIMQFDRAVGFLPFFAAGLTLPLEEIMARLPRSRTSIFFGSAVVLVLPILQIYLDKELGPFPSNHGAYHVAWGAYKYIECENAARRDLWLPLWLYWCRRLARQTLELVQGLVFLLTIVPRRSTWCTEYGKYTLYSILFATVALRWKDEITRILPLPVWTSTPMHFVVLTFQFWCCCGLAVLLSSAPLRRVFSPFLEPRAWLEPLLFSSSSTASALSSPSHDKKTN